MISGKWLSDKFPYLGKDLLNEILNHAQIKQISEGTELVREGQYVNVIPLLLDGLIKVYTHVEDKELLLYYIQINQSCIMSFSAGIHQQTSRIVAVTEEQSTIMILPSDKVAKWIVEFPQLNRLFYEQYDMRYQEMIDSIHQLMHLKLDQRVYEYLLEKKRLRQQSEIKITHKEIAIDLATAREVVSRILKKLETEKKICQLHDSIEVF